MENGSYKGANKGPKSLFSDVPITALSKITLRQLSAILNSKKNFRSHDGYDRDWRGIAVLAQVKSYCDETALSDDDSIVKVLQLWSTHNPKTATLVHLERFLGIIERWNVFDEIYENLVEDTKNYNAKLHRKTLARKAETDAAHNDTSGDNCENSSNVNILTTDDVIRAQKRLPLQQYDAFLLFTDADINYVVEILAQLEDNTRNNFKLCLKGRDLLPGVFGDHLALTELIEQRCKHLVVILTEDFMTSPENKFLVSYTRALQIERKTGKIIPLLYEDSVNIPRSLISRHLKYNDKVNFWNILTSSMQKVNISKKNPDLLKRTDVPSININDHDSAIEDDDIPKKKKRNKCKRHSSIRKISKSGHQNSYITSQIDWLADGGVGAGYPYENNDFSDSSLSTSSEEQKMKKHISQHFINFLKKTIEAFQTGSFVMYKGQGVKSILDLNEWEQLSPV